MADVRRMRAYGRSVVAMVAVREGSLCTEVMFLADDRCRSTRCPSDALSPAGPVPAGALGTRSAHRPISTQTVLLAASHQLLVHGGQGSIGCHPVLVDQFLGDSADGAVHFTVQTASGVPCSPLMSRTVLVPFGRSNSRFPRTVSPGAMSVTDIDGSGAVNVES